MTGHTTSMKRWSSISGYSRPNYTPELLYIQNIWTRNKDGKRVFTVRDADNSYYSMVRDFRQTDDAFLKKQWSVYSSFSNCTCSSRRWVLQKVTEFSSLHFFYFFFNSARTPKTSLIQPKVLGPVVSPLPLCFFINKIAGAGVSLIKCTLLKTPTLKGLTTINQ